MKHIQLAYLPQWNPTHPQLALPMLAGYLERQGFKAKVRDFNVEFYDWLLTSASLTRIYKPLARAQRDQGLQGSTLGFDSVVVYIEKAKSYLRAPPQREYHFEDYVHARALIDRALEMVSCASRGRLLITWDGSQLDGQRRISTGLAALKGTILDTYLQDIVLPDLERAHPDLLGFSVTTPVQLLLALMVAERMKHRYPESTIVVGGSLMPSLLPVLCTCERLHAHVDGFGVFEGEATLAALAEARPLEEVPNLIFWKNGRVLETQRVAPPPLEDVGTPDFRDLPLDRYFAAQPILPLLDYRGCYWKRCAFCTHHRSYSAHGPWRDLDAFRKVIRTLSQRHNTNLFYFVSESIDISMMRRLGPVLSDARAEGIRWFASARFEEALTHPSTANDLASSGCRLLIFGLESGHQRVLDAMKKGTRIEHAHAALLNLCRHGIRTSTMQFAGFPTETVTEAEATLTFLVRNRSHISIGANQLGLFVLSESSLVAHAPEEFAIKCIRNDRLDDTLVATLAYAVTQGMDSKAAEEFVRKRVQAYTTSIEFACLLRDRAHSLFVEPADGWDAQLFSSAALPADVRLATAELSEFRPILALSAVLIAARSKGRRNIVLCNLWTQRFFRTNSKMLSLLKSLNGQQTFDEILNLSPRPKWTLQALRFLAREAFLATNSCYNWEALKTRSHLQLEHN